jgi:hypothetical protein
VRLLAGTAVQWTPREPNLNVVSVISDLPKRGRPRTHPYEAGDMIGIWVITEAHGRDENGLERVSGECPCGKHTFTQTYPFNVRTKVTPKCMR